MEAALNIADHYGFYVSNYENRVGTVDLLPRNDHHLDILSHLDCVPVADGWTVTEPFSPVVVEGNLYGRGSADDKGPSVAALYAVRCVKELGIPLQHNVRLIWGCDEECGSPDIACFYQQVAEAEYSFCPDADFPVINIEKGGLFGSVVAEYPEPTALPRIVSIDAGLKINVVPDQCHMEIEGMRKGEAEIYCAAAREQTGVRFSVPDLGDHMIAVDAYGAGSHAAFPQNGNNAITAMLHLAASMHMAPCQQFERITALSELFPHGD